MQTATAVASTAARHEQRTNQIKALNDVRAEYRRGIKRVGLMMPTGSGKTTIGCEAIRGALERGKRSIFLCDRIELIDQTSARMDAEGIPHGVIQAQHPRARPHEKVQVASIHTLQRRRFPECEFMVVDEFHTVYKATHELIMRWDNLPVLGLSATPFTRGLGKVWQSLVVGPTTQELIDDGYLVPVEYYGPPSIDTSKLRTVAGEYHKGDAEKAANKKEINADIVRTWLSRGEDRQTICFATSIPHARAIAAEFQAVGVAAAYIDCWSDTDERKAILQAFGESQIRIVCCVDVLTKGYDQPLASCIIDAKPTKSLINYIQRGGRGLRTAPGKKNLIYIDHAGNVARLGFLTDPLPAYLDDGKPKKKADRQPKLKLPSPCPKCFYMKAPGVHECPNCGFAPERQPQVVVRDVELVKIKKADPAEKQRWYSMLLHHADIKGYQRGWVAHKYKKKFGVWPRGLLDIPAEPDEAFRGYIKHLNIAAGHSAKARKPITKCRYCDSDRLKELPGKGPHHAGIGCANCGRHLGWLPKPEASHAEAE